jgi:hypothetical protein
MKHLILAALIAAVATPSPAQRFNWDHIGEDFCRFSATNDLPNLNRIITPSLASLIQAAYSRRQGELPPRAFFQAYDAEVGCEPSTRNAALIEIRRSGGGGSPSWTDYLVVVPERDGTTRIDDILFATRRSDTLRTRLDAAIKGR